MSNRSATRPSRAQDGQDGGSLGARVRVLRAAARLTIRAVAERAGLAASSISKIENDQLSPTYENIIRLARGLGVDIAELFSDARKQSPRGRRSITRNGEGKTYRSGLYTYEMLCTDLIRKQMTPLKARILARSRADLSRMISHEGEEVLIVLSGAIELHTEFYEKAILRAGDCAYFDSTMGHVCLLHGVEDAEVFWVCSSSEVLDLMAAIDADGTAQEADVTEEAAPLRRIAPRRGQGG